VDRELVRLVACAARESLEAAARIPQGAAYGRGPARS
jgi:hypothetical protein